jgi:hypothetical protein
VDGVPLYIGATIWYAFKPNKTMTVEADTFDSNFDTTIAVYQGNAVDTLNQVVCDDDAVGGQFDYQSNVTFKAKAGHTYYFQVGGWHSATGNIVFRVRQVNTLKNDNFANARVVGSVNEVESGNTRRATSQAGDPVSECAFGSIGNGASVWFKRTVANAGAISIEIGATFEGALVSAWEGPSIGQLQEKDCGVAGDDDQLTVDVQAGDVVYIMVSGDGQSMSGAYQLFFDQP